MQQVGATTELSRGSFGQPSLIFFSELASPRLLNMFYHEGLLDELIRHNYGIALGLLELSLERAELVRLLNKHAIQVVAWLQLPAGEGSWLHLQNYPQAIERYRAFHNWAHQNGLRFDAVGLDIEPPPGEIIRLQQWGLRDIVRRLWLARENILYPAARNAYTDLIAEIHHDGYEVHVYQLPLVADDRRAGTTLIQRALDVVDLPADVEVLMCYSSLPAERLGNDLGGALIASYGPAADALGIGSAGGELDSTGDNLPPLSWEALERDLVLAAHYTDIIYVYSLEGCFERALLPRIAQIDWDGEVTVALHRRLVIGTARISLLVALLTARFSRRLLAWLGWGLAAVLLFRQFRPLRRRRKPGDPE